MADAQAKIAQGFDCITFKSEADWFMSTGQSLLAELRGLAAKSPA